MQVHQSHQTICWNDFSLWDSYQSVWYWMSPAQLKWGELFSIPVIFKIIHVPLLVLLRLGACSGVTELGEMTFSIAVIAEFSESRAPLWWVLGPQFWQGPPGLGPLCVMLVTWLPFGHVHSHNHILDSWICCLCLGLGHPLGHLSSLCPSSALTILLNV